MADAESAAVLREFLLIVEKAKQPLDAAIRSLAPALATPSSVDRFLAIHPQCEPLLRCWPETVSAGTRWEQRESVAVFLEVLAALVMAQTGRDAKAAEALALKVIRDKSALVEKVMTWSDKPIIEFRALELCRALVAVNGAVAREFVRLFHLQSPVFVKMAARRMKKPEPVDGDADTEEDEGQEKPRPQPPAFQIREAYVRLVLELMACPDTSVRRFALKEGGIAVSLFKSIEADSPELLTLLFSKLEELVLRNPSLDHRAKSVIFSGPNILLLLPLLQSEEEPVAALAAQMLDRLFFGDDALYGVATGTACRLFLSKASTPSTGTSFDQVNATKVIRNTLVGVGVNELMRSSHAQAVVTKLLTTYPAATADYLSALAIQLEPRAAYRWFCVASLVQKLLSCSLAASGLPDDMGESVWCTPQLLATRLIAPCNFRKELSRGIQHVNDLVVYSSLGVIESILHRFEHVILSTQSDRVKTELENEMRFLLPSPEALVSLLLKLCSSTQPVALIYIRALSVFRLYLECFPQMMSEVKLDFTKLLAWQYLEDDDKRESALAHNSNGRPSLQSMIVAEMLRFLLAVDTSRLRFLLQRGGSGVAPTPSKLLLLLLLDVNTQSRMIRDLCDQVLTRVLWISGVFGQPGEQGIDENEEIRFWLQSLHNSGKQGAHFLEELVQVVSVDPFASVAAYQSMRSQAGGQANFDKMAVSPVTVALVRFLNSRGDAATDGLVSQFRTDAEVTLFAVRVLMALLYSCEIPEQIVLLIASDDVQLSEDVTITDGDTSDDGSSSKKRKRAGKKSADSDGVSADVDSAYSWIQRYCREQLAPKESATSSHKKSRVGDSPAATKWKRCSSVMALREQLASLYASAYGSSWKEIADNCLAVTGSFELCHHYLLAHGDADVLSLITASASSAGTTTAKKTKKSARESVPSNASHPFVRSLPPQILLQNLLYRIGTKSQATSATAINSEAIASCTSSIVELVTQKDRESLLDVSDAAQMSDQLLFFFARHYDQVSEKETLALFNLLLVLLTFIVASSGASSMTVQKRVAKLHALAQQLAPDSKNNASFLRYRLIAVQVTVIKQSMSLDGDRELASARWSPALVRSAMVPLLALRAVSDERATVRLAVLEHLLRCSVSTFSKPVRRALIEHTIQYLCQDDANPSQSLVRSSHVRNRLWRFLETRMNGGKKHRRQSLDVFVAGLQLLRMMGGVTSDVFEQAIEATIVPAVLEEAASLLDQDRSLTPLIPQRVVAVISDDGGVFLDKLETVLLAQLQQSAHKPVSYMLVNAFFDVFGHVRTVQLQSFARSLVADCFESILTQHKGGQIDRIRLSLLRHLIASSRDDELVSAELFDGICKRLVAKYPSGADLTRDQITCVLLLVKSRFHASHSSSVINLVVFLVRCGVIALTKSSSVALQVCTAVRLITDELLASRDFDASITLTKSLAQFRDAVAFVKTSSDVVAFRCFVELSAVLLRLVTAAPADAEPSQIYDFAAHLTAMTTHGSFSAYLSDHENETARVLLVRVVAGLVERADSYQAALFQTLLGAYTMSLSTADRCLRALLVHMEQHSADLSLARVGFRFGASASSSVVAPSAASRSDLVEDVLWIVNGGLDQGRVRATVEDFPLDRNGASSSDQSLLSWQSVSGDVSDDDGNHAGVDGASLAGWTKHGQQQPEHGAQLAYDPAYLLPMLSHFMAASDLPNDAFVQQGLLGVALRATSSNDEYIRSYAFGILAHIHESLAATDASSSEFKAGRQIHLLLDVFRSAIAEPLEPAPSVVTVFLNDAVSVLCRPAHTLYPHVNHFLLARPALDLSDVPMFYSLFNSRAPLTYKQERSWLLHTLRRGVCEDSDVLLLVRRHVLSILMSFFASELADEHTQALVLQILLAVVATETGSVHLVTKAAAIEWISIQFARGGTSPQPASGKSSMASSSSSTSVLVLLMAVLQRILEVTPWHELSAEWHAAASLQTANAVAALHRAVDEIRSSQPAVWSDSSASVQSALADISEVVIRTFGFSLSLATLEFAVAGISSAAPLDGSDERSADRALSSAETLLGSLAHVVQHREFERRRFPQWAALLKSVAALAERAVSTGAVSLDRSVRAKRALASARALLNELPTLKQLVVHGEGDDRTALALQ